MIKVAFVTYNKKLFERMMVLSKEGDFLAYWVYEMAGLPLIRNRVVRTFYALISSNDSTLLIVYRVKRLMVLAAPIINMLSETIQITLVRG